MGEDYNEGKPKDLFRKDRMLIKRKTGYYNKVEGRENEGGCCEPVPFSTNGHAVVSN